MTGADVRKWVTLSTASVVILLVMWVGLSLISTPHDAAARLRRVNTTLFEAQRSETLKASAERYSAGAICSGVRDGVFSGKALLDAAAATERLSLAEERFTRSPQAPQSGLTTIGFDVAAKGEEPQLKRFLNDLAQGEPMLLTDSVDFSSDGAAVTLAMKGRFLCRERQAS